MLAGRVLEPLDLVQIIMIQPLPQGLEQLIHPPEVEKPAGLGVDRPGHAQLHFEAVAMQARTLVPGRHVRQPMSGLEPVFAVKLDLHERKMIAQAPRSTSLARLDARIYALAVARGINTMGFSIVLPFLAIYLYTERGIAASSIGAVYTLSGIVGAATQVVGGELADRFGRRLVMVSSLLARAGVLGAMGVAIGRGGSFATLGGLVVANAMLRSLFEPAAFAAVTDLAPIEDRVAAFGVQRIGINVGWAMGPA